MLMFEVEISHLQSEVLGFGVWFGMIEVCHARFECRCT